MLIWIISEIGFIHTFNWAQTIYLVSGLLQLVLVFALVGVAPCLPRVRPLTRRANHTRSDAGGSTTRRGSSSPSLPR